MASECTSEHLKSQNFPGGACPHTPLQSVGLRPLLLTKGVPVVQFAQGLLNPLGGPDSTFAQNEAIIDGGVLSYCS